MLGRLGSRGSEGCMVTLVLGLTKDSREQLCGRRFTVIGNGVGPKLFNHIFFSPASKSTSKPVEKLIHQKSRVQIA